MNTQTTASAFLLLLSWAAAAADLETDDGLSMRLGSDGTVRGLSADGRRLPSAGRAGGFFIGEYRLKPGPELVPDGGFERGVPALFTLQRGCVRDTTVGRTGTASLRVKGLHRKRGDYDEGFLVNWPLKPNTSYMITFYMKAQGLDGMPILHLRRRDAEDQPNTRQANFSCGSVYHDWTRQQHSFQTLPGTARGELFFHVINPRKGGVDKDEPIGTVWLDDFSIRQLPHPTPEPIKGLLEDTDAGVRFTAEREGLRLETAMKGLSDRIEVEGTIGDTTGNDRCVQLFFRLPVKAESWAWGTGLGEGDPIEPGRRYVTARETGRDTNRFVSPYPYSSLDGPRVGLSLAVPPDRPTVYRMFYDEEGYYTLGMDLGLTKDTAKFPGLARFGFSLSRHDPAWGMRAAAKKYFTMYPEFFQVRTKPGGVSLSRKLSLFELVGDPKAFGQLYMDRHGGGAENIKAGSDLGMYVMIYNEPWMWRSHFGNVHRKAVPAIPEAIATEKKDIDVWDTPTRGFGGAASRAYAVRAYLNSAFHDEFGNNVVNSIRVYGWPRNRTIDWLTNPDPDIVGEYGEANRGMLSWTYEYELDLKRGEELGGKVHGVRYDSLGEHAHLGAENHRRAHFAFADLPLTFSYRTGRPCQLGYFAAMEYMMFVREKMLERGGMTCGNGGLGVPWLMGLLDCMFREVGGYNPGRVRETKRYQHARMLIYRKNGMDYGRIKVDSQSPREVEEHLNNCLTYAWWPGIWSLTGTAEQFAAVKPAFARYVPVLTKLSEAGWEPVTFARAEGEGIVLERFGGEEKRPLYFTLRNEDEEAQEVAVAVDTGALGRSAAHLGVHEVVADRAVESVRRDGKLSFSISVSSQTTVVLAVK